MIKETKRHGKKFSEVGRGELILIGLFIAVLLVYALTGFEVALMGLAALNWRLC